MIQQKYGNAVVLMPPNMLRKKVGWGGLGADIITRAQKVLEQAAASLEPAADNLLGKYVENLREVLDSDLSTLDKEDIIHPVVQLKSQGSMFNYPLITMASDSLVNFLESLPGELDADAMEVVQAHFMTLHVIISQHMHGDAGAQGKVLVVELRKACERYYKKYEVTQKQ